MFRALNDCANRRGAAGGRRGRPLALSRLSPRREPPNETFVFFFYFLPDGKRVVHPVDNCQKKKASVARRGTHATQCILDCETRWRKKKRAIMPRLFRAAISAQDVNGDLKNSGCGLRRCGRSTHEMSHEMSVIKFFIKSYVGKWPIPFHVD